MKRALTAEFRKLLTVRSTYVLTAIALLFVSIGSFYGSGFKSGVYDTHYLANAALSSVQAISFFGAIVSVLLMAHEYRYSTIVYALTMTNNRNNVLAAKILAVLVYTITITVVALGVSVGLATLGASIAGHHIPHQDFDVLAYLARSIFYCSGFALAALLFTTLLRNITASIAVLFIVPNTLETLLSLLLKGNAKYLPFTALQNVLAAPTAQPGLQRLSPTHSAGVFFAYIFVGWIIAWWLFLRRDAN
ncbi:MAG: hypothetical protein JWO41_242 [Candidatus Saccharibacteria bacterium]|nr:hypothetical protein [Candidatus Saccharibacteria bacterium]